MPDEADNGLTHSSGSLAMAKTQPPHTGVANTTRIHQAARQVILTEFNCIWNSNRWA